MPEDLLQSCELFEVLVDCLVPGAAVLFQLLDGITVEFIWQPGSCRLATVTQISLRLLSGLEKLLPQAKTKDGEVRIGATRKWTIDPDNVASFDAKGNLVPVAGGFELVGIEALLWMLQW